MFPKRLGSAFLITILLPVGPRALISQQNQPAETGLASAKTQISVALPGIERRAVLASQPLTFAGAQEMALEFLASSNDEISELTMANGADVLKVSYVGTIPRPEREPDFSATLNQLAEYDKAGLFRSPVARVLRIKDSALLSFRSAGDSSPGSSALREKILRGTHDPTSFTARTKRFRLLTFSIPPWPRGEHVPIAAFFQSDSTPSCSDCELLAKQFTEGGNVTDVELEIRPDSWFANEYFPVLFRFAPDDAVGYHDALGRAVPPTIAQYYKRLHMTCRLAMKPRKFGCEGHGIYDRVVTQ